MLLNNILIAGTGELIFYVADFNTKYTVTKGSSDRILVPTYSGAAGDLLLFIQYGSDGSLSLPTDVTPTGFTQITTTQIDGSDSNGYRASIAYKIATGDHSGDEVVGFDPGSAGWLHLVCIKHKDSAITAVAPVDIAQEGTTGSPTEQTANASGGTIPLIVFNVIGQWSGVSAPQNVGRTTSRDPSWAKLINKAGVNLWFSGSSGFDVTVNAGDGGVANILQSGYLEITL